MLTISEREELENAIIGFFSTNNYKKVCSCYQCANWGLKDERGKQYHEDRTCTFFKVERHFDDYCSEGVKLWSM